jgi:hypothetical protein
MENVITPNNTFSLSGTSLSLGLGFVVVEE